MNLYQLFLLAVAPLLVIGGEQQLAVTFLAAAADNNNNPFPLDGREVASTSSQCSEHQVCVDQGYTGRCCPTKEGPYLDCCDEYPAGSCRRNDFCYDLGYRGDCCPKVYGTYTRIQTPSPRTEPPGSKTLTYLRNRCFSSVFVAFAGVYLFCCDELPDRGSCDRNDECKDLGLRGPFRWFFVV